MDNCLTVSELIESLEYIKETFGDIKVYTEWEYNEDNGMIGIGGVHVTYATGEDAVFLTTVDD